MKAEDLKNSILQLAMQGKLVPQDPNDEPASVLLEKIHEEKEKLIKDKKIKRNNKESFIFRKNGHFYEKIGKKCEPVCIDDEIQFDVPYNWELCRLSSLGVSTSGKTPKSKELHPTGKYPYFKVGDMNTPGNELYLYVTENYLSEDYSSKLFAPNSIVYPKNGGAVFTNKRRILKQESVVDLNTGVFSPYSCLDLMYVYMIFQSIDFKKYHKGTALPTIDKKKIDNILIGLPPFNEQKRIVNKIKEILPLIEEYGINEVKLDKLNSEFPDKLKSSILQEAIQGKLVPQNPDDEPASVLLEKIKDEKERLIKEKKIKRNKNESYIFKENNHFYEKFLKTNSIECIDDELPFEVPKCWEWARLDQIGVYKKGPFGSALTKSIFVPKSNDSVKVYEQKNAIQKNDKLGDYYIPKDYYESKMKGFGVEPGDIIVSCAGTIGETYVMPKNIEQGIINQALMRMNIVNSINLDYFLLYFDYILKKSAIEHSKGSAIKNIPPFKIFKRLLISIPSINEQERIIKKVKKLEKEIDKLHI